MPAPTASTETTSAETTSAPTAPEPVEGTPSGATTSTPRPGGPPRERPELGRLLIQCPDRPGVVSAVSTFLAEAGANITSLDQFSTAEGDGTFFQRTEFHLPALSAARDALERDFDSRVAQHWGMSHRLTEAARPKRVAIMVSKTDHCVLDLLWRHRRGDLDMNVVMVVSNHPDLADDVRPFGIPYVHVPATRDNRVEAEKRILDLLRGNVDLVVLARYMQIITPSFLDAVGCPLINIHHSFLPAFIGAGPYQKAKDRGVKLVGATAHYVTPDLDEGPIIDQDVVRVDHRHTTADVVRLGADVERAVLSRAVRAHLEDRVSVHRNSTIVF